jgi:hypothetical protein
MALSRPGSFLETIIALLLPYFIAAATDKHEARSEILDTLVSYDTRTSRKCCRQLTSSPSA